MSDIKRIWDFIQENEIDDSWRRNFSEEFRLYRERFSAAQKQEYLGDFPLCLEIEASYYCNLECPFCPRSANYGERNEKHMSAAVWQRLLEEIRAHRPSSILMDHEAESLMNKNFFSMLKDVKDAGVLDIWLHTNANLLTPKTSEKLIDGGITKINFSLDAATKETYEKVRVGGKYERVISNIEHFLKLKKEKQADYIRVRVSFIVMPENQGEKQQFYEFWKSKEGVNVITFQKCQDFLYFESLDGDETLSEAELNTKYARDKQFHCSMPWEMPVIDVEGNVVPCGAPVREHNKSFVLGNIMQGDSVESCWKSPQMERLRQIHKEGRWYLDDTCRICVKQRRRDGII
ncbi:MAG: radical SAM protein [Alphaproteobacteria bacterium]|nr:radical SAM protein [Alphaproteobacteria bacterium]